MTEKKKLLIFHLTIAPYRIDFFNYLCGAFDTHVCLLYWNLKGQKFDYQKIYDQFLFEPVYLPHKTTMQLCRAVWRQIKDFDPDIIVSYEFGPVTITSLFFKLFSKKKRKLIVTTDDSYDMISNSADFTTLHRWSRKLVMPFIDDAIVIEPRVEEWYRNKYGKGVYFPIIVEDEAAVARYGRLLPLSEEIARRYNLIGKKVLLSVCRLVNIKNIHGIIDAFDRCDEKGYALVIVGGGEEFESLKNHARSTGKDIILTGRLEGDELYSWYNIASVFILASFKEPFGAVINEALLAGCRIIVSDKAGSVCLVDDNNGESVPPCDITRMSIAIDRQLQMAAIPSFETPRKSLMRITFKEKFDELMNHFQI